MQDSDFFCWWRESSLTFQSVAASADLQRVLQHQSMLMGFDYFSFCLRHPIPFTRPNLMALTTNYPEPWLAAYQMEDITACDLVLKEQPGSRYFSSWEAITPLSNSAQSPVLHQGYTQGVIAPNRTVGYLSVSNHVARPVTMPEEELMLRMLHICELSMMALRRIDSPAFEAREMRLSKRECEILQWTAEGKTSSEIAMILAISENTVNFHQKNMQKRFNAPNKTQIACYAAATGLI
ncbi:transcriptional regulator SdiA [Shimwellia pseudoproteus]|uniref:transcriptional regulator SdiA n=1 Tax=Shimwellia pseudoproteus TaxID=570012 RepID=UPI0018EB811B|nr:transcriptional regulator SdiA [Shimwellia pseudoproteus]MBJ3816984.1 transcriptional regulator SdiA [Shimwellia pseudoproteus]